MDLSRRQWLAASAGMAAWPEMVAAQQHAHEAIRSSPRPAFDYLDPAGALEIEALIAQIIPSDETPGAREAGVIYFIDRALSTFAQDKRDAYRAGIAEVQGKRKALFPASASIASLSGAQQIELLLAIDKSAFFELLRLHTVLGFLGPPSYGGNRNAVGWKLIGFEDEMSF